MRDDSPQTSAREARRLLGSGVLATTAPSRYCKACRAKFDRAGRNLEMLFTLDEHGRDMIEQAIEHCGLRRARLRIIQGGRQLEGLGKDGNNDNRIDTVP